jgi:hypothetical protein
VATNPVVRVPRGALKEALRRAPRRYEEPSPDELSTFAGFWTSLTGQRVTGQMMRPLALVLRVHGPRSADVLRVRFAQRRTVTNLIPAMLEATGEQAQVAPDERSSLLADWTDAEIEATVGHLADAAASNVGTTHSSVRLTLEVDTDWRVRAMRSQVPAHGPVPVLRARPDQRFCGEDICISCGEPNVDPGPRCPACIAAAQTALGWRP